MYFSEAKSLNPKNSFTLVELLIVIAIIAILGAATIFVINPTEILKKTRDTVRISDLKNLDLALQMAELEGLDLGNPNVVYISLPDSNSNCSSYSLPSLPSGWSYHCASEADYRKVDGNGWIPVNFTALSSGAPFSSLPVDPINDENHYYMYFVGGSYELNTWFESQKYAKQMSQDGGDNPCLYEKGSNLSLGIEPGLVAYWKFNEGEGTTAKDSSGNNNDGTLKNGPQWVEGKVGMALEFDGSDDYVDCGSDSSLDITDELTVEAWIYPTAVPSGQGRTVVSRYKYHPAPTPDTGWNLGRVWGSDDWFRFRVEDGAGNRSWAVKSNFWSTYLNQWVHVVGVFKASEYIRLYINGELVDNNTTNVVSTIAYERPLVIGARANTTQSFFQGIIDEVRVYHRALSSSEIRRHYLATKGS